MVKSSVMQKDNIYSVGHKHLESTNWKCSVREMQEHDLYQLEEVERNAFPTLFPPTAFRRELNKKTSSYLVACRIPKQSPILKDKTNIADQPLFERLLSGARQIWDPINEQSDKKDILGFIGVWYVIDQAHIISVGVRTDAQGNGIGELLLISAIRRAISLEIQDITLEVRVSNLTARNLYSKYGFLECGTRRGYYSDNREDAIIMTTPSITTTEYQASFSHHVKIHKHSWGHVHVPSKLESAQTHV